MSQPSRALNAPAGVRLALIAAFAVAATPPGAWRSEAPLPVPRTEVAAALAGNQIVIVGGYLEDGSTSARVDLFDPTEGHWRTGPDLPEPLNHAV
jgi:non-specific serine/threonine protein kinase